MDSIRCPRCGQLLPDFARFCRRCGSATTVRAAPPAPILPPPPPVAPPVPRPLVLPPVISPPIQPPRRSPPRPAPAKSGAGGLSIFVILIIFAVIGFLRSKHAVTPPPKPYPFKYQQPVYPPYRSPYSPGTAYPAQNSWPAPVPATPRIPQIQIPHLEIPRIEIPQPPQIQPLPGLRDWPPRAPYPTTVRPVPSDATRRPWDPYPRTREQLPLETPQPAPSQPNRR